MVAVITFGTGPKVLVIHGGPGFNCDYLIEPLRNLSSHDTFVLYDQTYSEPTLDGCSIELLEVIDQEFKENSMRIIAHSWGCLVLYSALARLRLSGELGGRHLKAMLINPVPITKQLFDLSITHFQQRIPPQVIHESMELLVSNSDGTEAMAKLLPYYVSNRAVCDTLALPLSFAAYQAVMSSLPDFDFSSALPELADTQVLLGDEDITPQSTIRNVLDACRDVQVVSGTGHFPLHESPEQVLPTLASWLV